MRATSPDGYDRFIISGYTGPLRETEAVGIVDTERGKFAEFYGPDPVKLQQRLVGATERLNKQVDTTTGYVWEDMQ